MKMRPSFQEYIDAQWDSILSDLRELIEIPSVADTCAASPGAPFGPQARAALDTIVEIAARLGLHVSVEEGYVALCDVPGESDEQLGVIGHLDVVPAGPGWDVEPFTLTSRDGWLLGRGVVDDKGPILLALWALAYWCDVYEVRKGGKLPHPVRMIFGSNEENGMHDVEYYHRHFDDPAFLFTPDAEFPVCNGEKGLFGATIRTAPISHGSGIIADISAGTVPNAVPGQAFAILRDNREERRLDFGGVSAHASLPEKGTSALKIMVNRLLQEDLLCDEERRSLELCALVADDFYGKSLGLAADDSFFGKLTGVAGTLRLEDDCFVLTYDVRFPTSITADEIERRMREALSPWNDCSTIEITRTVEPFLVDADSEPIKALLSAYNEVTGDQAQPFTMGGATYAREFMRACSFGMDMPWMEKPEWVGGMHGPNEGASEQQMKLSLEIYLAAFGKLFEIDLA